MTTSATQKPVATTADVLRKAKGLIDSPEKWIKGWFGRPAAGSQVITCFCSVGAIRRADDMSFGRTYCSAIYVMEQVVGGDSIALWNDAQERTHPEVMAAFDRAIAIAESEATHAG